MEKLQSQSAFLYPIRIPLKHSRKIFLLIAVAHFCCVLVLSFYQLSIPEWPLWLLIIVSSFYYWRRFHMNQFVLGAEAILLTPENDWFVINNENEKIPAIESPGSFVHPLLVVLLLQCQDKKISIILTNDNTQRDLLRRLRVRLRYPVETTGRD